MVGIFRIVGIVGMAASLSLAAACNGSKGPTAPGGNTGFIGTWNGTLTAPSSGTITVRWVASQDAHQLSGTMTVSKGSFTMAGPMTGAVGGDKLPADLSLLFDLRTDASAVCGLKGGLPRGGQATHSQITGTMNVEFLRCPELTGRDVNFTESGQLSLSK